MIPSEGTVVLAPDLMGQSQQRDMLAELERVMRAVRDVRLPPARSEAEIHGAVAGVLTAARIRFRHEADLGDRCRADFLTDTGIAIEIKKGKPNAKQLNAQALRYAHRENVTAIVLLVERCVAWHPVLLREKPVRYVGLNSLLGVAL